MNRLMIAATLALTLGAYVNAGECEDPDGPEPGLCALWYDVTVNVKTTIAKSKKVKVVCDDPYNECFRIGNKGKTFKGIYATCDCDCEEDFKAAMFFLWNTKEKKFYAYNNNLEWTAFYRIGKPDNLGRPSQIESAWTVDTGAILINAQGFGTWDKANYRVKNISGSLIGELCAPVCPVPCDEDLPAVIFDCHGEEAEWDKTIAYGTWSMKFNKNKTALVARTRVVTVPVRGYGFANCFGGDTGE